MTRLHLGDFQPLFLAAALEEWRSAQAHTFPSCLGVARGLGALLVRPKGKQPRRRSACQDDEAIQPDTCSVPERVNDKHIACQVQPKAPHCAPGAVTHSKQAATGFATHFVMVSVLSSSDIHHNSGLITARKWSCTGAQLSPRCPGFGAVVLQTLLCWTQVSQTPAPVSQSHTRGMSPQGTLDCARSPAHSELPEKTMVHP